MSEPVYTLEDKKRLKFYQGDTACEKDELLKEFYSVPKAYLVMNSLMYDGIENERIRIEKEGKFLNSKLFYDIEEIIEVYISIFNLMKYCYELRESTDEVITYRLDRKYSLECFQKGSLVSFTSTSKNSDYDKEYFRKKDGLVIFNFRISSEIPYIDINEILGKDTRFSEQNEILLPPFLSIKMKELVLNEKEKIYRDVNHNPPIGKYEITLENNIERNESDGKTVQELRNYLVDIENIKNAVDVIDRITSHKNIDETGIEKYVEWKKCFKGLIRIYYSEILGR